LAEPVRLMLEYSGVEYDQKLFVSGDPPAYDRSCWTDVRDSLDLDFPNLPYYVDGKVKITESWAIMRHIARKNDLLPEGDDASATCDQAEGVVQDFRWSFVMMCYDLPADFTENKKAFFVTLPTKLRRFDKYLAARKYLAGDKLTYVDFALCEILDQLQMMESGVYGEYANVNEYLKSFMKMEKVAAYRSSSRFKKYPCNNQAAWWGYRAEA